MEQKKINIGVAKKITNWMVLGRRHQVIPNKKNYKRHPKYRPDYRNCDEAGFFIEKPRFIFETGFYF